MVQLRRFAVGRDRAGIADAVFVRVRRDPRHFFRSPEGNAKAIRVPPVCTANWHTCPAGAAHRKITVCCALALLARPIDVTAQSAAQEAALHGLAHFSCIIPSARMSFRFTPMS